MEGDVSPSHRQSDINHVRTVVDLFEYWERRLLLERQSFLFKEAINMYK